jgi:hypothetical protein
VEPLENNVSPEHPLAELATLALAIGLIGLGLFAAAWLAVEGAVRWLPVPLEQRVFSGVEPEDAATPPALSALLGRLARHWPGHRYTLRVGVVELDAPNAFALPGGQLLVTSALLREARSENELAFVLGHELGHLAGRDPLRALGRGLLVSLARAAVGSEGASVAATAAQLGERSFSRVRARRGGRRFPPPPARRRPGRPGRTRRELARHAPAQRRARGRAGGAGPGARLERGGRADPVACGAPSRLASLP